MAFQQQDQPAANGRRNAGARGSAAGARYCGGIRRTGSERCDDRRASADSGRRGAIRARRIRIRIRIHRCC